MPKARSRHDKAHHAVLSATENAGVRHLVWIRLLLAVATLAAFGRLVTADFTNLDDPQTTYDNPHLTPPSLENIGWFWTHPYMDIYAPLPFSLWGALLNISKVPTPNEVGVYYNSFIFHGVNVLLHLAGVLVLFELLRRLVHHAGAAALGALLFALHPVQVEPVAWISGGKDLLYGLFSLVALWQYVVYVQRREDSKAGQGSSTSSYAIALVAFVPALFSKPTAVVTPVLALIIDVWLMRRRFRAAMASLWPWFALAVPFVIIARLSQPALEVQAAPIWSRPLIALDALAFYLYKLIYPIHLAFDYGRRPQVLLHSSWVYWTWAVPLLVGLGLWILRRKVQWLAASALLFLVCLLPVLGLTPFDYQYYSTVTDHYLYLAMIGPALVVAMLTARYWRPSVGVLAGIILIALAVRSTAQAGYWRDSVTLFEHNLRINPDSGFSHERLAHYYAQRGNEWAKMVDQSIRQMSELQRLGREREALQMAAVRDRYKELAGADWAEAAGQYERALKWNPLWPTIRMNYAGVLANLRQFDQAMAQLARVIENQSSLPPSQRGDFETLWFTQGMKAYDLGDDQRAAEDFSRALQLRPGDPVSTRAYQIVTGKMRWAEAERQGAATDDKP